MIAVVLVNWNSSQNTIECISSLLESSVKDLYIIVVDNASTVGAVEEVSQLFPDILLIRNKENLGFGRANNIGITNALKRGAEYILLLNNDTIVDKCAIEELRESLQNNPRSGIVTPRIRYYDEPSRLWAAGGQLNLFWGRATMRGNRTIDNDLFDEMTAVDYAVGAGMMFPSDVLSDVGGFDPRFFHSAEDVDLSLRVREKGRDILYVPTAVIWHKVSRSSGGADSPHSIFYLFRGLLLLRQKHLSSLIRCLSAPLFAIFLIWSMFRLIVIRRRPHSAMAVLRALTAYRNAELGEINP